MRKLPAMLLVLACVQAISGCQSIIARSSSGISSDGLIYPGVKTFIDIQSEPRTFDIIGEPMGYSLIALSIIDLPFSVVLDTVLLPVDAVIVATSD